MKRLIWMLAGSVLLVAGMALVPAAAADIEVTAPDGRRVLLMYDGTWRYLDAKEKEARDKEAKDKEASDKEAKDKEATDKAQIEAKKKQEGEAVLLLESKTNIGNKCRFALWLTNNLAYEIRSLAPHYAAYRANGVLYDTVSAASQFAAIRPGDKQYREIEFSRISCGEIVRVQVIRGDRCEMGELHKFSEVKGECLARVRVVASDLVRFDKDPSAKEPVAQGGGNTAKPPVPQGDANTAKPPVPQGDGK